MGHILGKILKLQTSNTAMTKEAQTQTSQIEDFQSYSNNILKTPVFDKEKNSAREFDLEFLKSKMLKNLNLDPRSPTVGIYRTPIVVQNLNSNDCTPIKNDSPISVYSSNDTFSIKQEIMTPLEPSVNISGFEKTRESEDEFETYSCFDEQELPKENNALKISDQPNTSEALKLLKEIQLAEENFIKRAQLSSKKSKKQNSKFLDKKSTHEFKLDHTKTRIPLSNITSSTNSPSNQINSKVSACKVLPETGSENFCSSKSKQLVQWDQNNTVII